MALKTTKAVAAATIVLYCVYFIDVLPFMAIDVVDVSSVRQ